jgi:hypothetical protein
MSQFNRFVLALDLLDGDWDARWVLADLLLDEGDDQLASFARNPRRINREGDLDLAICLVPFREAILLGCAIMDRGMTGRGTVRRHAWLLARLARIRRLVRKHGTVEQFVREGRALANYQVTASVVHHDCHLQDAAQSLGTALEQAESAPSVGIAVAALARSLRAHRRYNSLDELHWQVDRTRQALEALLEQAAPQAIVEPG